MTIFVYKGFDNKSGNWKYPPPTLAKFFSSIWRLGQVWDAKFNMSQIKNYLMLQNARLTAFTVSELLKESQQRE